jgi:hypothetical protein
LDTANQSQSIFSLVKNTDVHSLKNGDLQRRLKNLEEYYFLVNDQKDRQRILLLIDDFKIEIMKREI